MKSKQFTSLYRRLFSSPTFILGSLLLTGLIVVALIGPIILPFEDDVSLPLRLAPPSFEHPFGCDLYGRDVLRACFIGARISLIVSFVTVMITSSLGTIIGLLAAYFRGFFDKCLSMIIDIVMAFPGILLTMTIASILTPSILTMIISISLTGWTGFARIVRAQVLSLREREYITANIALGATSIRTIAKHILPNIIPPIVIAASFSLSSVILIEASLSFLGLGVLGQSPSWGSLLNQGRTVLTEAPHLSVIPGLLIMLLVLSFNYIGDALRDALDPKEL
ncbi:MAG: ABC transporter permease [Oligoflexales bacterium]|nr:ABC transporter permease [Oligoflexales bacterium]